MCHYCGDGSNVTTTADQIKLWMDVCVRVGGGGYCCKIIGM